MTDAPPLIEAQETFVATIPFRALASETVPLAQAVGRVLAEPVTAPMDSPPYSRAIVEGFLVRVEDTLTAAEGRPMRFTISGEVMPGDGECPLPETGCGIRVATGSLVCEGEVAVVRPWEAKEDGEGFSIERAFTPRFFIEDRGCDIAMGSSLFAAGDRLTAWQVGQAASLGMTTLPVMTVPRVALFSSGDEVIPHSEAIRPGAIYDSNSVMLAAALAEEGAEARFQGIMTDDFNGFKAALEKALESADMALISGGTAIGGRDFISDLIREVGELVVDGVPMRSGRPLIMGVAGGKPIIAVAGHPPEALRGFRLFGVAALNRLLGRDLPPPDDRQERGA